MMEKKYQLVAWTKNVADAEKARLYMIPSLESEVQASLIADLAFIHQEEYKFHGRISVDLARRAIKAYENMSRFEYLTRHIGDSIRYLFFAAQYCIWEDDCNWAYYDTVLGHYSHFCGELRHEFVRLCEKAMYLARNYRREDILQERKPKDMLALFLQRQMHVIYFKNWRLFGEIAQKLCHMRVVKWHSVARFYVVPND